MKPLLILLPLLLTLSACSGEADGTWSKDCSTNELGSGKSSLIVNGESITTSDRNYTDSDCSEEALTFETEAMVEYGSSSDDVDGATEIDLIVDRVKITPYTKDIADTLNDEEACGYTDWDSGETKDVTGDDCDGFEASEGEKTFQIYKVEETAGKKRLYLGLLDSDHGGKTEEERPEELNSETAFLKED